ncbi:MAG: histidine phosphatase family protein [Actinomycetota bacterium]|nr:histidine phosphatase family protein [Actinomycetota bacterium]
MTVFLLVRHAVTSHTGQKLTGWAPGVHLSDDGRSQAEAVAERLAGAPIRAIYSSPIDRTLETAHAIAARHRLDVQVSDAVGEVQFGNWTNRSLKSLARTKLWVQVQRFPSAARFPQGETLREVQARALAELERIQLLHPKQMVCVVSHADVIKLVAAHYLGVHIDLFQRIAIGPASVTAIAVGAEGPMVLSVNASAPVPAAT